MISKLPIRSRHFQKTNPNLYQQDRNAGQDEGEQCFDPFLFQCSLTHVHQNELMVATCLNLSILHIEPMSHFVTLLKQGHRFLGIDLCDDQYIEGCERNSETCFEGLVSIFISYFTMQRMVWRELQRTEYNNTILTFDVQKPRTAV